MGRSHVARAWESYASPPKRKSCTTYAPDFHESAAGGPSNRAWARWNATNTLSMAGPVVGVGIGDLRGTGVGVGDLWPGGVGVGTPRGSFVGVAEGRTTM